MKFAPENIELFKAVLTGACHPESGWQPLSFRAWDSERRTKLVNPWERRLERWLARRGWQLVKRAPYDERARATGRDWPWIGYTMVGGERLNQLHAAVETVLAEKVPGDLMETGVWRGGACLLMRAVLAARGDTTRRVWLADSFVGLPPPTDVADGWDLSGSPFLAVTEEEVRDNFRRFGLLDEQVRFLPGWFADTLPGAPVQSLAVLRLDGDLYSSTRTTLEALYAKVSVGGFVIVDDYHAWPGCRRATDEFRAGREIGAPLHEIDGTGVWWRKEEGDGT